MPQGMPVPVGPDVSKEVKEVVKVTGGVQLTEPLLAQSDALELLQLVLLGSTVDDGVLEDLGAGGLVEDGGLIVALDLPCVSALVVDQSGGVVALVQVLEDGGEDLGLLVRKGDALARGLHVLRAQGGSQDGRLRQDLLMGGKDACLAADDQGDDGRVATSERCQHPVDMCMQLGLGVLPTFPKGPLGSERSKRWRVGGGKQWRVDAWRRPSPVSRLWMEASILWWSVRRSLSSIGRTSCMCDI